MNESGTNQDFTALLFRKAVGSCIVFFTSLTPFLFTQICICIKTDDNPEKQARQAFWSPTAQKKKLRNRTPNGCMLTSAQVMRDNQNMRVGGPAESSCRIPVYYTTLCINCEVFLILFIQNMERIPKHYNKIFKKEVLLPIPIKHIIYFICGSHKPGVWNPQSKGASF